MNNPDFHTTISEWFSDESLYEKWGKHGIALMSTQMEKPGFRFVQKHNIELIITVHPWRNNVQKGNPEDRHVLILANSFALKHHIGFINFYSSFINGEGNLARLSGRIICLMTNHWSSFGHQKVGRKLSEFLTAQLEHKISGPNSCYLGLRAFELGQYNDALMHFTQDLQSKTQSFTQQLFTRQRTELKLGEFGKATERLKKNPTIAKILPGGQHLKGSGSNIPGHRHGL